MPEQSHLLSDETLRLLGYRLLCSIYAEYEWKDLRRDDNPDVLDDFLGGADSEVSQLLVSLAALARASDDALGTLEEVSKVFPQGVGTQEESGKTIALTPREACNKILHAKELRWDFRVSESNPLYNQYYRNQGIERKSAFKQPFMHISGELRGSEWQATLDVVPFVIAVSNWDAWKWRFA